MEPRSVDPTTKRCDRGKLDAGEVAPDNVETDDMAPNAEHVLEVPLMAPRADFGISACCEVKWSTAALRLARASARLRASPGSRFGGLELAAAQPFVGTLSSFRLADRGVVTLETASVRGFLFAATRGVGICCEGWHDRVDGVGMPLALLPSTHCQKSLRVRFAMRLCK